MNASNRSLSVTPRIIRWAARLLGLATTAVLLSFMIGEGFNPVHMQWRPTVLSLFFPIGVLAGLCLAWRWEGLGGALTLISLAAFYALEFAFAGRFPRGWAFAVFALPGVLFLAAWLWQCCAGRRDSV